MEHSFWRPYQTAANLAGNYTLRNPDFSNRFLIRDGEFTVNPTMEPNFQKRGIPGGSTQGHSAARLENRRPVWSGAADPARAPAYPCPQLRTALPPFWRSLASALNLLRTIAPIMPR